MICDNLDRSPTEAEMEMHPSVAPEFHCLTCGGDFCEPCREAIAGSKNKCPQCGGYVGNDPSCKLGGGCGK